MYPSSSSSSSHGSMGPTTGSGLTRYDSAPGSLLTTAVDSVIGPNHHQHHLDFSTVRSSQTQMGPPHHFTSETSSLSCESTCKASTQNNTTTAHGSSATAGSRRSYGLNQIAAAASGGVRGGDGLTTAKNLVRHSSSPPGFLHYLTSTSAPDNGFSVTKGIGNYNSKGPFDSGCGISRLSSQLSFTGQDSLSQISEESENVVDGISTDNGQRKAAHSYATASFGIGSWDDTNAIIFSPPPSKRAKNNSSDLSDCINSIESQFQFSLSPATLEMATVEKLLQIPQDSVPCKIRAKRGCATHPRSIAERERRTRISRRLKKLQELVPNMDKQTSYADMLDLAVQNIKALQDQIEKLNRELENCTCGCKQTK